MILIIFLEVCGIKGNVSVALHDVRVSDPAAVVKIEMVIRYFGMPLTVHLVCDVSFDNNLHLKEYIMSHLADGSLEIVYHGVNHLCERKAWRILAWYHNYQAEYIINSESLRHETVRGFVELSSVTGLNHGICPPCWIASSANKKFLDSLNPLYRENLIGLVGDGGRILSTVISLGSTKCLDLVMLRIVARLMTALTFIMRIKHVRVAVHTCDLDTDGSLLFLKRYLERFGSAGYRAVLLKSFFQ